MPVVCVTPSLDCKLAKNCAIHFRNDPDMSEPLTFRAHFGDLAVFACPSYAPRDGARKGGDAA